MWGNTFRSCTGCCKTSGQLCKLLCDSFLGVFFLFFCSFDCQIWAIFHSGTLWPWEWIFFVENIIMKKCKISGLAQIGSSFPGWILRVANFGVNYLRHFFINSKNSCAHFAPIFLHFPKHSQLLTFGWFWRKLWPKIRKIRNHKICQFEPTLKSSLFSGWIFSIYFSSLCPKSTKVKNRP